MARGRRSSLVIKLTPTERRELEALQRRTTTAAGLARRARIVLLRAADLSLVDIERTVGVSEPVVRKWIKRYRDKGARGLGDKPRPGRPPVFSPRSRAPSGEACLRETG